jgi:hypothetical protein
MDLVVFNVWNQEMDTIPDRNTKRVPEVVIVTTQVREGDHGAIDAHEALHLVIERVIDPAIMETPLGVHLIEDNPGEQLVGPPHERKVL